MAAPASRLPIPLRASADLHPIRAAIPGEAAPAPAAGGEGGAGGQAGLQVTIHLLHRPSCWNYRWFSRTKINQIVVSVVSTFAECCSISSGYTPVKSFCCEDA